MFINHIEYIELKRFCLSFNIFHKNENNLSKYVINIFVFINRAYLKFIFYMFMSL